MVLLLSWPFSFGKGNFKMPGSDGRGEDADVAIFVLFVVVEEEGVCRVGGRPLKVEEDDLIR